MTTAIKRRRGTTTQHSTFTGLEGEITVDTTKDTLVVHDGATAGGYPLLREDLSNNTNVITTTNTKTLTNKTFGDNPTFSAGTANGVAYLNGSKVLTTGSALTFDGTALSATATFRSIGGGNQTLELGTLPGISFLQSYGSGASDTPLAFYTGTSEKMRLTSTGLGIGTSSPAARVSITEGSSNLNIGRTGSTVSSIIEQTTGDFRIRNSASNTDQYIDSARNVIFGTGTSYTERMRIDSSGNLLVGTTSGSSTVRLQISNSSADYISEFVSTHAVNPYGPRIRYSAVSPNGTGNWFLTCSDNLATRFQVYSNGGIANYSANNVNLSDRREKTNFTPASEYLSKICAIPVQTFNYIDQSDNDIGKTLGVVAQDVQAVAPELVMESNWGSEEEPKVRLSIYQTDLQYALMKCIQELKAELDATKAEVAALKGA